MSRARPHALDHLLPLFPTYRDVLSYKSVVRALETPSNTLTADLLLQPLYRPEPPPIALPFTFAHQRTNSLRRVLLVISGCGTPKAKGAHVPEDQPTRSGHPW
jgi:hypothetical protein